MSQLSGAFRRSRPSVVPTGADLSSGIPALDHPPQSATIRRNGSEIAQRTAAAAGRSLPSAAGGLAHAEVEPARCYASFSEAAADLVEIVDRHGQRLIAIFEAAWPETRRCAGFCAPETGSVVSLGLEDSNAAPGAF